jgi:hypothetical protein
VMTGCKAQKADSPKPAAMQAHPVSKSSIRLILLQESSPDMSGELSLSRSIYLHIPTV